MAGLVDDLAMQLRRLWTNLLDDISVVAVGHETNLLALRFFGSAEPETPSAISHFPLAHLSDRKGCRAQLLLTQGKEKIRLIRVSIEGAI